MDGKGGKLALLRFGHDLLLLASFDFQPSSRLRECAVAGLWVVLELPAVVEKVGAPSFALFAKGGKRIPQKTKRPESSPGPGPPGFKIGCA
jgi:hypothetical protein